ncbi:hypothetical protein [Roseobacter denitrificans]|uniref:hypothetical protein n=1 Tax=Roseobacter denitrificans TaxID=2434 RepID=UPI00031BA843|nr:hypothetical protein [Roseobacter denitrificans]
MKPPQMGTEQAALCGVAARTMGSRLGTKIAPWPFESHAHTPPSAPFYRVNFARNATPGRKRVVSAQQLVA